MSARERWQRTNDDFLAASLAWLRLRLAQSAQAGQAPVADSAVASQQVEQAAAVVAAAAAAEPAPALVALSRRFGLTRFEQDVLLLCAAMEFDTRMPALCARAQQEPARAYPTFALALALFDDPAWDALSPERPLRYWRLIEINQPGAQPLIGSALKADERIVNFLKGLNYLDDRLAPLVAPVQTIDTGPLPPSHAAVSGRIARELELGRAPLFQLLGADDQSKRVVAQHAAARFGLRLYRLPAEAVPVQNADHETFARLWQRESALLPIALYVDAAQLERTAGPQTAAVGRLLAKDIGALFLDTLDPWPDSGRQSLLLDVAKPAPAEQQAAWREALAEAGGDSPPRLAGQFNFNLPSIRAVAANALAACAKNPDRLREQLWSDCLRHSRPALDRLAQPIDAKARWQDLELAAGEKGLLRQIAQQVKNRHAVYDGWGFRARMNRGLGISVLFTGESGAGKTMAAEVIANELGLLLYRIDLSAVVNKYIGETEKNLRKLFDAAEDGGAILFFDEADSLFGKRSEVKDSHDRYANIEINYLLQRMECYQGLAILATNMKGALDKAFMRRLRFVVNFPFPGAAEREAIWQKVFPPEALRGEIDCRRLARLDLTGGSIHNVALSASHLAVAAGTPVTMPLILDAARAEFRKLEKPAGDAEFRWTEKAQAGA